jgi:hypothetical protein
MRSRRLVEVHLSKSTCSSQSGKTLSRKTPDSARAYRAYLVDSTSQARLED